MKKEPWGADEECDIVEKEIPEPIQLMEKNDNSRLKVILVGTSFVVVAFLAYKLGCHSREALVQKVVDNIVRISEEERGVSFDNVSTLEHIRQYSLFIGEKFVGAIEELIKYRDRKITIAELIKKLSPEA